MKKQQQHQAKYTQKCEETHSKRYIDDNTQLQKTANSENIKNQKQRKKGERGRERATWYFIHICIHKMRRLNLELCVNLCRTRSHPKSINKTTQSGTEIETKENKIKTEKASDRVAYQNHNISVGQTWREWAIQMNYANWTSEWNRHNDTGAHVHILFGG